MTTVTEDTELHQSPPRRENVFVRIYRGETSYDFVGHRRRWFTISAVIILAGIISLSTKGLNFGIDFKGGTSWEVPANGASVASVQTAVQNAGLSGATVEILGRGANANLQVQADLNNEPAATQARTKAAVQATLARIGGIPVSQVNLTDVGPTWGSQITNKAIIAVIVFFVVVVLYISVRFEWKMALAALIAVVHDLLVVIGIYSIVGFQVTSDTVIAVLTILGYSLYDTVVVFDRVADNTKGLGASGRMTYTDVVNLSMNQTLARSINTSLVAILPVLSVLIIGAQLLGATTLQYFGLALVIGLLSGAYSSIFIAAPVLAMMKEREQRYVSIRQKLANRADRTGILTPRAAAMLATAGATAGGRGGARPSSARGASKKPQAPGARRQGVIRPGSAEAARPARTAVTEPGTPGEDLSAAGVGGGNGAGDGRVGAQPSTGAAKRPASGAGQPRGPAPRPRKGKGSRKGRRR
jgi:preprotein translocase subunit SecF